MSNRIVGAFFLFVSGILFLSGTAHAGFGITPPYFKNDSLARNSEFEQRIILTRSDPVEDLNVEVSMSVPGAEEWITIDRGMNFLMRQGETQLPMYVRAKIPEDAKFDTYTGFIRVVISPAKGPERGTVGISLGAQIDVSLSVVDKKIYDFKVRRVELADLEEGQRKWSFFFPGKAMFKMVIENIGNVAFGPTKVTVDIVDNTGAKTLETTENLNRIKKLKPFENGEVVAELPVRVPKGAYKAQFKIWNNDAVVHGGELTMSVLPPGSIPGYVGYGFAGLARGEQALIVFGGMLAVAALYGLARAILYVVQRKRARSR